MQSGRTCVFCGGGDLTKEHVWPRWVAALLPTGPFRFERRGLGDETRTWTRVALDVTVSRVCRTCNNGWLSDLEEATRPILQPLIVGSARTLEPNEAETAALWCVKTALLFQLTHPPQRRFAPGDHYRWVYEERKPPPNVFAWLGGYNGTYWSGWYVNQLLLIRDPGEDDGDRGYCATVTAGTLVFQVIGLTADSEMEIEKASEKEPYIAQLWPPKHERLRFPRPLLLDDSSLPYFADPFAAQSGPPTPNEL